MVTETIMGVKLVCLSSLKLLVMHCLDCHKCPYLVGSIVKKNGHRFKFFIEINLQHCWFAHEYIILM